MASSSELAIASGPHKVVHSLRISTSDSKFLDLRIETKRNAFKEVDTTIYHVLVNDRAPKNAKGGRNVLLRN